jgi:hypothetical protein
MQTFLPHASFAESAQVLDMKRLGKQRVEVLQLLNSFHKPNYKGWKNHPAREMWRGYENGLVKYGQVICVEWLSRGYKDTCYEKITAHTNPEKPFDLPPWIGREDIHLSHKSRLIQKFPEHYKPLWPDVPDNLEYVWPVPLKGTNV